MVWKMEDNAKGIEATAVSTPDSAVGVEIKVRKKYFDPEEHKVTLEISVGAPFNTTVRKTGSISRIAFQLVEQFSLPVQPKDLAKVLQRSAQEAELKIEKEAQLYRDFLSWFTENYAELVKNNKCFVKLTRNEPPRARLVESAMTRFFQAYAVPSYKRSNVLSYWRERGWLKTHASDPHRFKKMFKFKAQDGTTRLLRIYEIELRYEEIAADSEEMPEIALLETT